jgi:hypothetical protein
LLAGRITDGQTVRVDVASDDPSSLTISAAQPVAG